MKRFTAIALAALMVLTVFASVIPATAATVDSVEIRGPVYNGTNLAAIVTADLVMDYQNFAGFYYDFDNDEGSENLTIVNNSNDNVRGISKLGIVYSTTIITGIEYEFADWTGTFQKIGYLAEEHVPIEDDKAAKLSKLLMDEKASHTVRTGQTLELGEGYAITPQQIDVDGNKVWLELTKNGEYVDDKIITTSSSATADNKTWNYEQDIAGVDDVVTLKIGIDEVFQGQVDSLCVIKGVWQISDSVLEIDSDTEDGILVTKTYGANMIVMDNKDDTVSLTKDSVVEITESLSFNVANSEDLRFYLMKEYTEPGTYEIRSAAMNSDDLTLVPASYNAANFAGFYYDLKSNVNTETLGIAVDPSNNRTINESYLVYNTTIAPNIAYEFADWSGDYQKIAFIAEEFVPIEDDKAAKLSKLLMDKKDSNTIRTGQTLELGEGYAITPQQIDVDGNKVWLELTKNGEYVDDKIITTSADATADNKTWDYEQDIAGVDDVVTLKIGIDEVFQGQVDSLCVIKGIWQISDSVLEIDSDTEVGILKAKTYGANSIVMENKDDTVSLTSDSTVTIAGDLKIKIANDDVATRVYLFREMVITGEVVEEPDVTVPDVTVPDVTEPEVTEPEVTEPEAPVTEPEAPVTEPEAPEEPVTPPEEEPGFEAIFAVAGLLAVAYLVRRN